MEWIALVGPELEENLSLRYLAAVARDGRVRGPDRRLQRRRAIFRGASPRSRGAERPPLLVGLSLAFQWRAHDFLALRGRRCARRATAGTSPSAGTSRRSPRADLCATSPSSTRSAARRRRTTLVALVPRARRRRAARTTSRASRLRGDGGAGAVRDRVPALPDLAAPAAARSRGEPARVLRPRHRAAGLEPRLLRQLHLLLHRRVARAEPARQALPPARGRATSPTRWWRCSGDAAIDIFVFHDDNFFVPGHRKNAERFARARRRARGAGHRRASPPS